MSTPRFLTLPPGVRRTHIATSRGIFAALEALPGSGVAERGPALLVPGFTGSKEDFIAVLQTLARARRRVVAIDMRGQYETPGTSEPCDYKLDALGADVSALADALGPEPIHLVGHSFGGLVTREAVIAEPSRYTSYTVMSSGPAGIEGSRAEDARGLLATLPLIGLQRVWTEHIEPRTMSRGLPDDIFEFLKDRMLSNSTAGLLGMAEQILSSPDRVGELAKATGDSGVPVLVLYGEDDDAWDPRLQAAMATELDAAKVVIPGAAHSPAVEAPETTASALTDFWNKAERTGR